MSTRQSSTVGIGSASDYPPTGSKKPGSQSGGRAKGGPRVSSKVHGGPPSEEVMQTSGPPRRKAPSNKDKDTKSRPPIQQRSHREGSKTGGGGPQHSSRGKGTESSRGHHHTNRHRAGSGSMDGGHRSTGSGSNVDGFSSSTAGRRAEAKILSSNRFEKLEIDPEQETSGESLGSSLSGESLSKSSSTTSMSPSNSLNLPSSASKGVEEKWPAKERSGRSGRGSLRGRGSARFQPDSVEVGDGVRSSGQKEDRNMPKGEDGGQKKKSPKQIKFDLPSDVEGVKEQGSGHVGNGQTFPEETAVGTVDQGGYVDSTGDGTMPLEAIETETRKKGRIMYDREFLLVLRKVSHSFPPPPELDSFDVVPRVQSQFSTDHPFRKDSGSSTEDSRPLKHPTALTLIKEHDKHFVGKVSLSPQRGSFQRGCSWKDRISNGDVSQNSSDASLKTPPPKLPCGDRQNDSSYLKFEGQKSQVGGPRPNGPRVINHVPLRDQEQANVRQGGKKGWRGNFKEGYSEPEPEWMEFGPTDRFDVIELKGFEEHEVGKDAKDSPTEELANGSGQADVPESPAESPGQATNSKPQTAQQQEDNEFILDGFDFSTGVSICQVLDEDEDDAGTSTTATTEKVPLILLPQKGVTDPSELGSVLLKALGVSQGTTGSTETKATPPRHKTSMNTGINKVVVSGAAPANVLTLDEIHAREDIHPNSSQPPKDTATVGEGMEAFNKLLAVLESKKPSKQENYSPPSQNYPDPGHVKPPVLQRVPRPEHPVKQSFGYPLDKELLNIEEDLSGTNLGFPEPNLRRLEQLERMLETMDRMDPTTAQLYDYHNVPAPHATLPPHRHRQMDQRVPMHPAQVDREGRGWMYPQEQRGRAHPTPQQLAAARQHQMLTNARGSANNWAVEMEQRRLMELRQMQLAKEKELYAGGGGATPTSGMPPQGYNVSHPSKPNISLLPTAVMRHMHTSNKPGQTGTDLPKTSSIGNRLDQDLTSKASQTHSMLNSLLNQNQDFSVSNDYAMHGHHHHHHHHRVLQPTNMRMAPPTGPKPSDLPPSGSVYPHYNIPHGMPVHNPYMY